jgi:glycosyltransferase involved in cell wall biosynthesis
MVVLIYAVVMLVSWACVTLFLIINTRKIFFLKDMPVMLDTAPSVAIIIAVKDEEADVQEALQSVCRLQYPDFRIIVVNDRSVDNTAAILQRIAATEPRITIITIDELTEGWLGKNHALYKGYLASTEEWLLFTDADVKFQPWVLQKGMNYIHQKQLDHLVVLPEVTSPSLLFQAMMNVFAIILNIKLRPWTVSDPASSSSIGVGAFNFVKRSAYEKAGTHAMISLRPDDDLKLGEKIKRSGGRQDLLYGDGEVSLAWYNSLSEFVNGLMKNTYSVFNYRFPLAMAAALAAFLVFVLPVPLLLLIGAPYTWMALAIVCCHIALLYGNKGIRAKWWHFLLLPFAGLVMVYIVIRASVLTERQGGIYWRKSFYTLTELRKQK